MRVQVWRFKMSEAFTQHNPAAVFILAHLINRFWIGYSDPIVSNRLLKSRNPLHLVSSNLALFLWLLQAHQLILYWLLMLIRQKIVRMHYFKLANGVTSSTAVTPTIIPIRSTAVGRNNYYKFCRQRFRIRAARSQSRVASGTLLQVWICYMEST